jgi:hypothetical protein
MLLCCAVVFTVYYIHCLTRAKRFVFSGITAEGQGVKVESSAVAQASTPDVADAKVHLLLLWLTIIN